MNLRQISVLFEDEVKNILKDMNRYDQMLKDQAILNPDPQMLSKINFEIAKIVASFGELGEQLICLYKPEWAEYIKGMKAVYDAEVNRQAKVILDAVSAKKADLASADYIANSIQEESLKEGHG